MEQVHEDVDDLSDCSEVGRRKRGLDVSDVRPAAAWEEWVDEDDLCDAPVEDALAPEQHQRRPRRPRRRLRDGIQ